MADKTIGELKRATSLDNDSLMIAEQQGEAVSVTGGLFKSFAQESTKGFAESASADAAAAVDAKNAAQSALKGVQDALNNLPAGGTVVINDLTTGGTTAALSAEMGKTLKQELSDLDYADVGAAPGGYGLGTSSKTVEDCNSAIANGWYYTYSGTANKPFDLAGVFLAMNRNANDIVHIYHPAAYPNSLILRHRSSDGLDEPEWVNPPMTLGVEYRTTERYNGKPVYVQAINFGALPNATIKKVAIDDQNHARAIRVSGVLSNGITIPGTDESQVDNSKPIQCYCYNNNVAIYAPYDASSKTAVVTAWYYKTTD